MSHRLWIQDAAKAEMRRLPGDMRQRLQREIAALADAPRPARSRTLRTQAGLDVEARRLRMADWRVIYVVDDAASEVGILAIRRRPPYDYRDLPQLLAELE